MWERVLLGIRWLFTLQSTVEEHDQELKALRDEVQRLGQALEELRFKIDRVAENERHEREKLCLRIENVLLNFERRLPPAPPSKPRRQRK